MITLFSGIVVGVGIAFLLNYLVARKLEKSGDKTVLQASAYIVCILLSCLFIFLGSFSKILDRFVDNQIVYLEEKLKELHPEEDIMGKTINTAEIQLQLTEVETFIDGSKANGIVEKMVLRAFKSNLSSYLKMSQESVAELAASNGDDGIVTVRSVFQYAKTKALDFSSRFFFIGQIIVIVLFVIYLGIYTGLFFRIKRSERKESHWFLDA